jgi:hypothetical protein
LLFCSYVKNPLTSFYAKSDMPFDSILQKFETKRLGSRDVDIDCLSMPSFFAVLPFVFPSLREDKFQ